MIDNNIASVADIDLSMQLGAWSSHGPIASWLITSDLILVAMLSRDGCKTTRMKLTSLFLK